MYLEYNLFIQMHIQISIVYDPHHIHHVLLWSFCSDPEQLQTSVCGRRRFRLPVRNLSGPGLSAASMQHLGCVGIWGMHGGTSATFRRNGGRTKKKRKDIIFKISFRLLLKFINETFPNIRRTERESKFLKPIGCAINIFIVDRYQKVKIWVGVSELFF